MTQGDTERIRQELADSFGSVADDYERSRPGYPEDAIRWISAVPAVILDVAAGTGKLTIQLRDLGHRVIGLDPSIDMLSQLRRRQPDIGVAVGRAEALPFDAESFDVLTVAQAFHWFDQPVALAEFARVLRSRGYFSQRRSAETPIRLEVLGRACGR